MSMTFKGFFRLPHVGGVVVFGCRRCPTALTMADTARSRIAGEVPGWCDQLYHDHAVDLQDELSELDVCDEDRGMQDARCTRW